MSEEARAGGQGAASREDHRSDVLVIDDDPGVHSLVALMLRPLSLDIEYVTSGRKALEVAARTRPRLILLDLMMPDLDGFGVVEQLGQQKETADIPVVVCSAIADLRLVAAYRWPPQVVEVVEKSKIRPAPFRDMVQRLLGGEGGTSEVA